MDILDQSCQYLTQPKGFIQIPQTNIVLNTVYKNTIKDKEKILSCIRGPNTEQILKKAKDNWIEYTPVGEKSVIAGIDGSFNSIKFQGIEFWVVTAVSIKTDGEILSDLHNVGMEPNTNISKIANDMEIAACEKTIGLVDLVLMDGSLHSQLMTKQSSKHSKIVNIVKKRDNVIFITKTSNTKKQFENLNSFAGDIYYYNHATKSPGFSKMFVEEKYGSDKIIHSTFVRLSNSTPIIKLEFLKDQNVDNIKLLINKLYNTSVGGYPYALKLAHNNCKISHKELEKMISMLGLSNEIRARVVLE